MQPSMVLLILWLFAVFAVAVYLFIRMRQQEQQLKASASALASAQLALDSERTQNKTQAEEIHGLKGRLTRYSELSSLEDAVAEASAIAESTVTRLSALRQEWSSIQDQITGLKLELDQYRVESHVREFGLYEPKFSLEYASQYKTALDRNYDAQKLMIKNDQAAICKTTWSVDGDVKKGRKMTEQNLKLMLWAFNGECDALISQIRYDNVVKIEGMIRKLFERINKLGQEKNCAISADFLKLKLEEVALVHEHKEMKQREAEEQRMIREQMREEEKARRELERAQQDAERESARYQQALDKARREAEQAHGEKLTKLQNEIARINQLLAEANARKERAIAQAQLTRSGYVYVISNIGSFGENVYKIGMTRRLEPTERVDELGDASVPFPFDIHAMIYSEDAPKLESTLHKMFDQQRVNLVNQRKEFFQIDLEKIRQAVKKLHGEFQLTLLAEAEEFRKSQMMRAASVASAA